MSLPLQGVKVLDFSTLLPGPYATMLLADMGADVLKVEAPDRDDMLRDLPPLFSSNSRTTSYADLTINRNKRSIALDLKSPESTSIIKQLIAEYDVVVEQFRPGVMKKLGLDYETLVAVNPGLIYCSITGYGQTGDYRDKAGHDINYLALSGLASYNGTTESGPTLSGVQIADMAGGSHHAVMGILASVIQRMKTGKGQYLDISMTDAAFALNGMFGAGALGSHSAPGPGENLLNGGSFYGYYQTLDGKYLSVGSLEPKFAMGFFQLLGNPDWLPRTLQPGKAAQQALRKDIQQVIGASPLSHWLTIFGSSDVCVEPVLSVTEAAQSRLMTQRGMLVSQDVDGCPVTQIAPAIKFSHDATTATTAAPVKGQHTEQILRELDEKS